MLDDVHRDCITSSVLLYVLWDAEVSSPKAFVDTLSERVRHCLLRYGEHVEVKELEQSRCNPRLSHFSPRRQWSDVVSASDITSTSPSCDEMEKHEQTIRIYVVVEKVASKSNSANDTVGELQNRSNVSVPSQEGALPQCQHDSSNPVYDPFVTVSNSTTNDGNPSRTDQHDNEIKLAESLARAVASSRFLRNRIDGLSIGITSDSCAAPGLEACMDAVSRSSQERRNTSYSTPNQSVPDKSLTCLQHRSPERSPISIVVCQPDDLETIHSHQHHPLLQSRVTVEWSGKGDYNTFSDRAMNDWRRIWSGQISNTHEVTKRKGSRLSRRSNNDEDGLDEPISTVMVITFVIGVVWYICHCYGDYLYDVVCDLAQQQQCVKVG